MTCVIIYGVGFQFAWGTIPWIYPAAPRRETIPELSAIAKCPTVSGYMLASHGLPMGFRRYILKSCFFFFFFFFFFFKWGLDVTWAFTFPVDSLFCSASVLSQTWSRSPVCRVALVLARRDFGKRSQVFADRDLFFQCLPMASNLPKVPFKDVRAALG